MKIEEQHDGKLISRLQRSHAGKVILYPHQHLKAFEAEYKKPFKKVITAPRVSDVVRKFAEWLRRDFDKSS